MGKARKRLSGKWQGIVRIRGKSEYKTFNTRAEADASALSNAGGCGSAQLGKLRGKFKRPGGVLITAIKHWLDNWRVGPVSL